MNAARIMRRPWVHQITMVKNMPRVLVTLAPGKVFAVTGQRTKEFENVAKAYEGTNRLLIDQDTDRYTLGRWGAYGTYLEISRGRGDWEKVGKFPSLETAQDYAHSGYGITVVTKGE